MRAGAKFRAARLQNDRHIGREALHHAREFETGFGAELPFPGKFDVRHQAKDVVAIFLYLLRGFFEVRTQQNLRPSLHADQFVRDVDSFLNDTARLLDEFGVDNGQKRRVIANVVFDDEQHRNAHRARVVQHIALVFDVFDDRDQNAGVALPEKDAVDIGDGIPRDEILDLAIVVSEDDYGNVESSATDFAGKLRGVHIADGEIGDDQIELRIRFGDRDCFGATGDVRDAGNLAQVQFERFVDEEFVEASIFAEDERVVKARDQKDVLDAEGHQILEAFEALFGVEDGLGDGANDHGLDRELLIILAWR